MSTPYPIKCRIRNADDNGVTRVDVFDDIGDYGWFGGLSSQDFVAQMASVRGDVECHINSGGGDVFEGIAIANALRAHKGSVVTVVDGIAASIASVIMQAGAERIVEPGSMVMIHEAYGGCMGDAAEMAKQSEVLDKVSGNIADIYAGRAGGTPESWRDAMKEETWYKADEAVAAGLADRVGSGAAELPPGLELAAYAFPSGIAACLRKLPVASVKNADGDSGDDDGPACKTCGGKGRLKHPVTGKPGKTCPECKGSGTAPSEDDDGDNDDPDGMDDDPQDKGSRPSAAGDQSCEALGHQCCRDAASARAEVTITGAGNGVTFAAALVRELHAQIGAAQGKPGTHGDHDRWDPDGNGDCDACPEGDTDHSHWAPDGEQIKSVPGKPMEDRLTRAEARALFDEWLAEIGNAASDFDDSDWDASKAWSNGAESDDPAAFYNAICAGKKAGDPATQDAHALPYKYTPGSKPNAAGVKNALSRLPQTDDLTNASEAKSLLQGLMKKINPDYDPEDHAPATAVNVAKLAEQLGRALKGESA